MNIILPFLLHHANRETKDVSYYAIKDKILKKYGVTVGHDVQHLPGKRCNACGGTGQHAKYSNYPPYKIYDYADCYHCMAGWYRYPQWVCLAKVQFGKYIFHKPLRRRSRINNPFVKEKMGFDVSVSPVIDGYISHRSSWFGPYALGILYFFYNRAKYKEYSENLLRAKKYRIKWLFDRNIRKIKSFFIKPKPVEKPVYRFDTYGDEIELPF